MKKKSKYHSCVCAKNVVEKSTCFEIPKNRRKYNTSRQLTQAFFQQFYENSSAKKTQNLPFGQKLKLIFVQKLKLGAAFLNIEKKTWRMGRISVSTKN